MTKLGDFPETTRFERVRRAGEGSFGVVYEAFDRERGTNIAMKVLREEPSGDAVLRFKNEFRGLQQVQHPNVVKLYELMSENGQWFFTMELLAEAQPFTSWVRPSLAPSLTTSYATERLSPSKELDLIAREGAPMGGWVPAHFSTQVMPVTPGRTPLASLPPLHQGELDHAGDGDDGLSPNLPTLDADRLREALRQLAIGVNAIHAAGKLHRDIKPNNVLVTQSGRVTLVDFGLTMRPGDSQDHCTPAYMAPEQATNPVPQPASDWYSVGCMLYEVLTGDVPFARLYGDFNRAIRAKSTIDPPSPISLFPQTPPELSELCMALLHRDPAQRANGDSIIRTVRNRRRNPSVSIRPNTARRPTFLGRAKELQELRRAFGESAHMPVALMVTGESGVGKSELVAQFLPALIEADAVILSGHCFERETVPYKAWDSVIDQLSYYWAQLPADAAAALVPPDTALMLQVFPVLRRVGALSRMAEKADATYSPQEQRQRVFGALRETFRRMSLQAPLVIMIDDMQWADQDSLDLLAALLGVAHAPNLLFLATVRQAPGAANGDSINTYAALLTRLPNARELRLDVLAADDALELARTLVGPDRRIDPQAVVAEAGGHPLFIEELVRAAQAQGTTQLVRLDQALQMRVSKLTPLGRRLLDLLAVAGQPISREAAAHALGSDMAGVVTEIEDLRLQHLIRTDGIRRSDKIATYHDRIKQAVLPVLSEPTLRYIHEQLATAFESQGAVDPEVLSTHWWGAGNQGKAAHYGLLAGDQAFGKLAFDRAARLYREVIARWPHAGNEAAFHWQEKPELAVIWERLGDALANHRHAEQAAEAFREAASLGSEREQARLLKRAADQLLRCGLIDAGQATLVPILKAASVPLPNSRGAAVATLLGNRLSLAMRGGFARALRRAERGLADGSVPPVPLSPDLQHRLDLCWTTLVDLFSVDQLLGILFYSRYAHLALAAREPLYLCRAAATEAIYITANNGDEAEVRARLADAARLALLTREDAARFFFMFARAMVEFLRGNWPELQAACVAFMEVTHERRHQFIYERAMLHQVALWALGFGGELIKLQAYSSVILDEAADTGDLYAQMSAKAGLPNIVWLMKDEPVQARQETTKVAEQWSQRGYHLQHLFDLYSQTQIDLYEGSWFAAKQRITSHLPLLAKSGLLRIQMNRALVDDMQARVLLAGLEAVPAKQRASMTRQIRKLAAALHREGRPWITGLATLIDAQLAGTPKAYLTAAGELATRGLLLHANACLAASGDPSATQAADVFFTSQGVVVPRRLAGIFVPLWAPAHLGLPSGPLKSRSICASVKTDT